MAIGTVPGRRPARLCVNRAIVPYGGLLRGRIAAGETLLVNGATGAYGTAAVRLGLALGEAPRSSLGLWFAARRQTPMNTLRKRIHFDLTAGSGSPMLAPGTRRGERLGSALQVVLR